MCVSAWSVGRLHPTTHVNFQYMGITTKMEATRAVLLEKRTRLETQARRHRADVVMSFEDIRNKVISTEREVLQAFDREITSAVKQLNAEIEACEVSCHQRIGHHMVSAVNSVCFTQTPTEPPIRCDVANNCPVCVVDVELLSCIINKGWSLLTQSFQDSGDDLEKIGIMRSVSNIYEIVKEEKLKREMFEFSNLLKRQLTLPSVSAKFQGRWIGDVPVTNLLDDDYMYGIGVSVDGKTIAVSCNGLIIQRICGDSHLRWCKKLPCASRVENHCNGQVCFLPNGNILVAQFFGKKIQEYSIKGTQLRCIGKGILVGNVIGVDANAHIIAVAETETHTASSIFIFNYDTAQVMKRFSSVGTCIHGVCISPDGHHLLGCWDGNVHIVSVVTGEIIKKDLYASTTPYITEACFVGGNNQEIAVALSDSITIMSFPFGTIVRKIEFPREKFSVMGMSFANQRLYVLDDEARAVSVFE